jgi:antitoxin ParD1/3/4
MNVTLTPDEEQFIKQTIERGRFNSPGEIVRAAFRLLKEQEAVYQIRLEELRKEIQIGLDQAERGELIEGEEVFKRLRAKTDGVGDRKA